MSSFIEQIRDPLKLASILWPDVTFYDKQREIIYSVIESDETFVPAANMVRFPSFVA